MPENGGLLLGAALLGGAYMLSGAGKEGGGGSGISGLGETVVNVVESAKDAVAVVQGASRTVKEYNYFLDSIGDAAEAAKDAVVGAGNGALDLIQSVPDVKIPNGSNVPFSEKASNAGAGFGAGIGGALGSAFLGLYSGAMTAGAHFVGRTDVTPQNAFEKFKTALPVAKDTIASGAAKNIVDAVTLKHERDFTNTVINEAKSRISSGGSSSKTTLRKITLDTYKHVPVTKLEDSLKRARAWNYY